MRAPVLPRVTLYQTSASMPFSPTVAYSDAWALECCVPPREGDSAVGTGLCETVKPGYHGDGFVATASCPRVVTGGGSH